MPFGFHPMYLIVLIAIVLIIFGPGKLPQVGGAIGRGLREFQRTRDDLGVNCSRSFLSLAEHLHLAVGVVDVDGDLVELVDELLDVLRLELSEVDRYP